MSQIKLLVTAWMSCCLFACAAEVEPGDEVVDESVSVDTADESVDEASRFGELSPENAPCNKTCILECGSCGCCL